MILSIDSLLSIGCILSGMLILYLIYEVRSLDRRIKKLEKGM